MGEKRAAAVIQIFLAVVDCDEHPTLRRELVLATGICTVPQLFHCDQYIGGCAELLDLEASGELAKWAAARRGTPPQEPSLYAEFLHSVLTHLESIRTMTSPSIFSDGGSSGSISSAEAAESKAVPVGMWSVPIRLAAIQPATIPEINLEPIYATMSRADLGLHPSDKRGTLFRVHPNCVRGSEVFAWLATHLHTFSPARVSPGYIAQSLLECGMLVSLDLESSFSADSTLYRFQCHTMPSACLLPPAAPPALPRGEAALFRTAEAEYRGMNSELVTACCCSPGVSGAAVAS